MIGIIPNNDDFTHKSYINGCINGGNHLIIFIVN